MADDGDDLFTPKLGRIRSRGSVRKGTYLARVIRRIAKAGGAFKAGGGARSFTGRRIGRGNEALGRHRAGYRSRPAYRRVVIKTRIVKLKGGGSGAARAHLRYIRRDGVTREGAPGELYDASSDRADGKAFLERGEGDRHQFRFIVSPEDATELADLKPFVRELMGAMETDLGTKLDWVAVDHHNTAHPHSHIVLRGKDDTGRDLVIARDYIAYGMRRRASELLTLELGPQTEREIKRKLERQVGEERFTDLDRDLVRDAVGGVVDTRHGPDHEDARFRRAVRLARLRVLARRGLADEIAPGRWRLDADLEERLRRMGERGDIVKTMHRGLRRVGLDAGASELSLYDPADPRAPVVTGRIVDRGLHDELGDSHYAMVDAADGRLHYVALHPRQDMKDLPHGAVVAIHPAAGREAGGDEGAARSGRRARYPGRVAVLSFLSLEQQVTAEGATWLDRQLVAREPLPLCGARFGAEAAQALRRRQAHLIVQGLARRDGGGEGAAVRYRRFLLRHLRRREIAAVGERIAGETGLAFVEPHDGERIEGIYRRPLRLASGKFAMIETEGEFALVPWRPALERSRDKQVSGILRGQSISWTIGRKRGVGIR